jgi:hypothetical protein
MGKKHREQMVVPQEIEVEVLEREIPEKDAKVIEEFKAELKPAHRRNMAYPAFLHRTS